MSTEFKLPELGENIESGDVISVLISVGDTVEKDQPVLELETDKATLEVPSMVSGVVASVNVKEGDTVEVGQVVLTVEDSAGDSAADEEPESEPEPAPAEAESEAKPEPEESAADDQPEAADEAAGGEAETVEFKVPDLGENIDSGEVISVLVSVGDEIKKEQPVLELETDKATLEVPSEVNGVVKEIHMAEGDTASVGQVILTVETAGAPAPTKPQKSEPEAEAAPEPKDEPVSADDAPEADDDAPTGEPQQVEVTVPDLGENIDSGEVVSVLVSVDDEIEKEQPILELETDKATLEVPADVGGVVKEIHMAEGDTAAVGQVILTVETAGAPAPAKPQKSEPKAETTPKPEPEESKSEPAPESKAEPDKRADGDQSARLDKNTVDRERLLDAAKSLDLPIRPDRVLLPAAPNVRRIARELGVDVAQVTGTGVGGRITMDDVKRRAYRVLRSMRAGSQPETGAGAAAAPGLEPVKLPDFSQWGAINRESMSNIRRATAKQMATAWSHIPHVTQFDKADISDLEELRKQFGPKVEESGGKLTVTAILLKVVAGALKEFPKFNASIDTANEEIIYKEYFHIGVAVDTDRGLLVPVIRDVNQKNIMELSVELGEVAEKARNRKLKLEDMQGATFTITNLGGIGGTNFTPIVNSPEVAILGVARGGREPVFNKQSGQFEPRMMLPLSLSYDHRLIDGADGARFLRWVVSYLEQPFLTALQGW